MLFELARLPLPRVCICRWVFAFNNVRPNFGILPIHFHPLGGVWICVWQNGLSRAFRLTDTAIDALIRVDHQHVLTLIETIYGAYFNAVRVFALNASVVNDIGHEPVSYFKRVFDCVVALL